MIYPSTPLSKALRLGHSRSRGVALFELLLILGVIATATTAVVATAVVVNNARVVSNEVRHAQEIAENIHASYITSGNYAFSTLNQDNAIREGIFPRDMLDGVGNPRAWDGDVLVAGTAIGGIPDQGASLVFTDVPAGACTRFVSSAAPGSYSVVVNNQPVSEAYSIIDPAQLASLCAASPSARVQFIHARNGGDLGSAPPTQSACVIPPSTTESIVDTGCPSGQLGTRTFRTDYRCPSAFGGAIASAPALVSDTCTPRCTLPSPSTQTNSEIRTGFRSVACPSGMSGNVVQSRTESRFQSRHAVCPQSPGYSAPVGAYTWSSWGVWSDWEGVSEWEYSSDNCTAASPGSSSDPCSPDYMPPMNEGQTGTVLPRPCSS